MIQWDRLYLSYKQLAMWGLPSDVSIASSPVVDPENLEVFKSSFSIGGVGGGDNV